MLHTFYLNRAEHRLLGAFPPVSWRSAFLLTSWIFSETGDERLLTYFKESFWLNYQAQNSNDISVLLQELHFLLSFNPIACLTLYILSKIRGNDMVTIEYWDRHHYGHPLCVSYLVWVDEIFLTDGPVIFSSSQLQNIPDISPSSHD